MRDFFPDNTVYFPKDQQAMADMIQEIYGIQITHCPQIFLNINLSWPQYDLPISADKYFLTFHTEQLDDDWVIRQALRVYPKPIMLLNDCNIVNNPQWPDNIIFVRWITWHQQLEFLSNYYGVNHNPTLPTHQLSSLSFRHSQYKKFITAWLLKNIELKKLILTWHGHVASNSHVHKHPSWATWLDNLEIPNNQPTFINWSDNFNFLNNSPLHNGNWRQKPYIDALVNLTNETFNYSQSIKDGQSYMYPGPYLSEKTYKPLLAGRPFVAIGQYQTLKTLTELGFDTDFGWCADYDNDAGDLTRIKKIFDTLEEINNCDIKQLYEQSLPAVRHNANHIVSGNLKEHCCFLNQTNQKQIIDFLC